MRLDATVELDGIDITDFVISINRDWSLCNSIQTVGLVTDLALHYYLDGYSKVAKPSLSLNIWEHGIKVFTGHVNTVKFQRKPDPFIEIYASDNYKFIKDYFIDETLGTTNGETVAYWIDRIITACGLSYTILSPEAYTLTVAPEIELMLIPADEALTQILAYAFSYAYVGTNGTVNIISGARASNIKFKSGPTTTYDDTDPTHIVGGNVTKATHQTNDTNTRNIVKVWGWKRWNLAPHESPYIQVTNVVDMGLPVPKTILYSSSMIGDYGTALDLSERILTETGKYDSIITMDCIGNPNIRIGQRVQVDIDLESEHLTGTAKITSIHSSMSADGYMMQVKTDEFCPKFAAWSVTNPYLYAGLDGNGVYLSRDKGVNWAEYNNGLPSGIKVASRVGADPYGNAIAIVNSGVWCEANNLWAQQTIPSGIPKSVGALGDYNGFAVLTAGGGNSNVYFSRSTAAVSGEMLGSTISGWEPLQMYYDDFVGRSYTVTAYDMYTKTGSAYVIATAASLMSSGILNLGTGYIGSGSAWPSEYDSEEVTDGQIYLVGPNFSSPYGTEDEINPPNTFFTLVVNYGYDWDRMEWITLYEDVPLTIVFDAYNWPHISLSSEDEYTGIYTPSTTLHMDSWQMWGSIWFKIWHDVIRYNGGNDYLAIRTDLTGPEGHVIDDWSNASIAANDADGNNIGQYPWFVQRHTDDVYDGVGDYFYGTIQLRTSSPFNYSHIRALATTLPEGGENWGPSQYWADNFYDVFSIWGSFEGPIPSGILPPTTGSGGYFLFNVGESGCLMISEIPAAGNVNDRLYVSPDGEIVIYNTNGRMLTSDDFGSTFRSTFPNSMPTAVPAVTRVQSPNLASGVANTFIVESDGTSVYQPSPTTTSGWLPATMVSGFIPKDAVWAKNITKGILVGGTSSTTKIYSHYPDTVPFSTAVPSDTGLPAGSQSGVLDLEYSE